MPPKIFQDIMRLWDVSASKIDSNTRAQTAIKPFKANGKLSAAVDATTLRVKEEDILVSIAATTLMGFSQTHSQKTPSSADHPKSNSSNQDYDQALKEWTTNDLTLAQQDEQAELLFKLFPFYKIREEKEEQKAKNDVTKIRKKVGLSVKRELAVEKRREAAEEKRAAAAIIHDVKKPADDDSYNKKEGLVSTIESVRSVRTIKNFPLPTASTIKVEAIRCKATKTEVLKKEPPQATRVTRSSSKRKAPDREQTTQKRIKIVFKGMPIPAPIPIAVVTTITELVGVATQPAAHTPTSLGTIATVRQPAGVATQSVTTSIPIDTVVPPTNSTRKLNVRFKNVRQQPSAKKASELVLRRSARIRAINTRKITLRVGKNQIGASRSKYL